MSQRLSLPPVTVNAFRRRLVAWYRRHQRRLPWRGTRDPYRIWVSEVMLQQTRVETVRVYYRRWLARFPTLAALAAAPQERVLKVWEGLGYYSRARNLHRAARQVNGALPASVAELQRLPGIGRYTAGAIASIAFGQRAAVVDGNVARVLARVFGWAGNVRQGRSQRWLWAVAEALLPARRCGEFNQAVMELGALVCVPRLGGWQCRLPNRGRPRPMRPVTDERLLVLRRGRVLLRQRPAGGLLAGLWELPVGRSARLLVTLRHAITDRRITLRVYAGRGGRGRWMRLAEAERLPMPAAQRRALNAAVARARRLRAAVARKHR
jgi:A/G-specific adenine glycosylase